MAKLDDVTIHRLVFETFGLRRYTQDSPIQPDVWLRFLKLAERGRLNQPVPLILTPKETPGKDGRPAGGAGLLAERIRSTILQRSRNQEREKSDNPTQITPEAELRPFKIASTARHVVIDVTFEDMLRYLLPATAWWTKVKAEYRDTGQLSKILADVAEKGTTIQMALTQLDDTEFFRFAALTAIISLIGKNGNLDVDALIDKLAPPGSAGDEDVDDLDDLPDVKGRRAAQTTAEGTVKAIRDLWTYYRQVVDETIKKACPPRKASDTAPGLKAEVLIWSIQRNRIAHREAATTQKTRPSAAARPLPSQVRLSRQTVKADAAIQLFSVSTADLAWAVVDTGIDAKHPAFARAPQSPKEAPATRVIATLDFTGLRDLLAEEFDVAELVKNFPWNLVTDDPGDEERRTTRILTTIDSIRRRNVNGRELDWSLLEPLIRRDSSEAPRPVDHHGTHVAGILGGHLPAGVPGDTEPFYGICPDIQLYDLRVFGDDAGGDEFTILAALDYISWVNRDSERPAIHGVNLSLAIRHMVDAHACGRTPICDACNRLVNSGTVVVAAAGNTGFDPRQDKATLGSGYRGMSITDPGNAASVITVGATHRNDPHTYGVSYFSSRGPTGDGRMKPDLVAPGEKIRSTVPEKKMLVKDGTSMAAPHVSGVCALLMARHREFIGQPMRIKEILLETATDLGRERCFQGAGLVDALRALQSV
jgi:serine protease AprX